MAEDRLTVVGDAGLAGNHVGPVAGFLKNAVDALMGTNLLAQHGHGVVRRADGVEGVDAVPRLHGRVRRLAVE